jgi:hypothetical protein
MAMRARGPLQAHIDGFDLHARVSIAADEAAGVGRLETLVRYCARPPLANERLSVRADGRVLLQLKTPWADGTTHVVYEPLDFLAKLAALIPRPHKNLVLYHGVLAARSKLRPQVVAYRREIVADGEMTAPSVRRRCGAWAELMRRAFGHDLLACPCGGKMVFLSCILRRDVIAKILARAGPARVRTRRTGGSGIVRMRIGLSAGRVSGVRRGYRSGVIAAAGRACSHALGMSAAMSSRSTPLASVGTMSLR